MGQWNSIVQTAAMGQIPRSTERHLVATHLPTPERWKAESALLAD